MFFFYNILFLESSGLFDESNSRRSKIIVTSSLRRIFKNKERINKHDIFGQGHMI